MPRLRGAHSNSPPVGTTQVSIDQFKLVGVSGALGMARFAAPHREKAVRLPSQALPASFPTYPQWGMTQQASVQLKMLLF